jgi:hypothetical protein
MCQEYMLLIQKNGHRRIDLNTGIHKDPISPFLEDIYYLVGLMNTTL